MKLDGKQKRIAAALAAGGVLALIVLLTRRGGGAAGGLSAVADPAAVLPSSYADNGAAMGQLSTSVSDLTGRVDTGLGNIYQGFADFASGQQELAAAIGSMNFAGAADPPMPAAPPASMAATGQPAGKPPKTAAAQPTSKQRAAAKAPHVQFQDSGARAGLNFKTVTKNGKVYRFYESRPGKADYGSGGKIYIRPASQKP